MGCKYKFRNDQMAYFISFGHYCGNKRLVEILEGHKRTLAPVKRDILLLEKIMNKLLDEFYIEQEQKELLENRGRYEKITLNVNQCTLNIITNGKDRIVFQIFSLFD